MLCGSIAPCHAGQVCCVMPIYHSASTTTGRHSDLWLACGTTAGVTVPVVLLYYYRTRQQRVRHGISSY